MPVGIKRREAPLRRILLQELHHRRHILQQLRIDRRIEANRADDQIKSDHEQGQWFPNRNLHSRLRPIRQIRAARRHKKYINRAQRHPQHNAAHHQQRRKDQPIAPQMRIEQRRIGKSRIRQRQRVQQFINHAQRLHREHPARQHQPHEDDRAQPECPTRQHRSQRHRRVEAEPIDRAAHLPCRSITLTILHQAIDAHRRQHRDRNRKRPHPAERRMQLIDARQPVVQNRIQRRAKHERQ